MFLESTQIQRCFNVDFYRWINIEKSTLNQRGYHVDRRRDVISTYINVESTLSVCWVSCWLLRLKEFHWLMLPYFLRRVKTLSLFRIDFFVSFHGWGGAKRPSLPKICRTYPTMMRHGTVIPYLKKFQKLYESPDTPFEFCWHQHFFTGNQQILLYQEIQI